MIREKLWLLRKVYLVRGFETLVFDTKQTESNNKHCHTFVCCGIGKSPKQISNVTWRSGLQNDHVNTDASLIYQFVLRAPQKGT